MCKSADGTCSHFRTAASRCGRWGIRHLVVAIAYIVARKRAQALPK